MKLLVFGATGGTGRQTVEQALAQGHQVTAFVRQPTALTMQHPNLTVVQGDAQDKDAVRKVVPGRDDVADFTLKHLTGNQYLRAAVGLTY